MDATSTIGFVQMALAVMISLPCAALAVMGMLRRHRLQ
jgi:hypothetical protein